MYKGWYQIAFERELLSSLTLAHIGQLALVIVRTDRTLRVFEATCPHRGANLADGRLDGEKIVCPFHGYRIGLGAPCDCDFHVREHRALSLAGMVFVLLSNAHDNGFPQALMELDATHFFVPGFTVAARVDPELVIENAFDRRHFQAVHQLENELGLQLVPGHSGTLAVRGQMVTGVNRWLSALTSEAIGKIGFFARIFSPNICLTQLKVTEQSFYVLTTATPTEDSRCAIRVSVAGPPGKDGRPLGDDIFHALLRDSRTALDQDIRVWEGITKNWSPTFTGEDDLVLQYHRFCEGFRT